MSQQVKPQAEPINKMRAATIVAYGGSKPTGVSDGRWKAMVTQLAKDGIAAPK